MVNISDAVINRYIADMIIYVIREKVFTMRDMKDKFNINDKTAEVVYDTFSTSFGLFDNIPYKGLDETISCRVKSIEDISPVALMLLNNWGYTPEYIKHCIDPSNPLPEKREVSEILIQDRDWKDANEVKPNPVQFVVMRLFNPNLIYTETPTDVRHAEDIKIGWWNGESWTIKPPWPKYDYSPLSNRCFLKEGTVVTHWAIAEEDELKSWDSMYDLHGDYKYLTLKVDDEHEKDVYNALMYGASFIARFGGDEYNEAKPGEGLRKYYEILCDLQTCIDRGSLIIGGNEEDAVD